MRFDTRNQKPKIWNIAVLSAVTLVLCLAVLLFGGTSRHLALVLLLDVYLLAVTILLVICILYIVCLLDLSDDPHDDGHDVQI